MKSINTRALCVQCGRPHHFGINSGARYCSRACEQRALRVLQRAKHRAGAQRRRAAERAARAEECARLSGLEFALAQIAALASDPGWRVSGKPGRNMSLRLEAALGSTHTELARSHGISRARVSKLLGEWPAEAKSWARFLREGANRPASREQWDAFRDVTRSYKLLRSRRAAAVIDEVQRSFEFDK